MTGLRERQKAGRRRDILAAASQLFRKDGFADTSVEAIAALAEVGTGTVYNYFKSKAEIGLAIYQADRDLVQAATSQIIDNPPADPVDAICRMMETDFETEIGYLDRAEEIELAQAVIGAVAGVVIDHNGLEGFLLLFRIDLIVLLLLR